MSGLRSVCVFLGPYRNLTTLTAAILQLHPQCQVLNHAGQRILPDERLNFFVDYSDEKLANFCAVAVELSHRGGRGAEGGSITRSHAFDHGVLREAYQHRYGEGHVKENVECIVWKEPGVVSNFLRRRGVDVAGLLDANARLRFLLPIRNPMDCARSIMRLDESRPDDEKAPAIVLRRVLDAIRWFGQLAAERPERFYSFYEFEFAEPVVERLRTFLQIDGDEQWVRDALASFRVTKSYDHAASFVEEYETFVEELFAADPEAKGNLLRFASAANERATQA